VRQKPPFGEKKRNVTNKCVFATVCYAKIRRVAFCRQFPPSKFPFKGNSTFAFSVIPICERERNLRFFGGTTDCVPIQTDGADLFNLGDCCVASFATLLAGSPGIAP